MKKNGMLYVALACMLCSACQSTEEEFPQRAILDLSGAWRAQLSAADSPQSVDCSLPGTTDENHLGDGKHPTDVTSQLTRLYPYEGEVYYTREVEILGSMANQQLTLIMERSKFTTLWVDGDSIGSQEHLYAPHTYPLPELAPGRHTFRIRVDNRSSHLPASGIAGSHAWSDATQTNWNGILGRFCLEATPRSFHIDNVQVYPDLGNNSAEVQLDIVAREDCQVALWMKGESWNSNQPEQKIGMERKPILLKKGQNHLSCTLLMPAEPLLWSEFHPALYKLGIFVQDSQGQQDVQTVDFGMRQFATRPYRANSDHGTAYQCGEVIGSQITINGFGTLLRGKHDACVFPLTGYAPMDVESWREVFRTAKRYGINHYRCHSYAPPQAAFQAADIEGIYLEAELPYWGSVTRQDSALIAFLLREGKQLLRQTGNSPSFMMMGLGNELSGDYDEMRSMLDSLRLYDDVEYRTKRETSRHLYNFGANDHLGWQGPQDGEDCFITCRVGGYAPDAPVPDAFSSHVRSSFSFADAEEGGLLNALRPNTEIDYTHAVRRSPRPVISHETGQFQVYPDYREISKYTGVLYPYNFEIFRQRLDEAGMGDQADLFHWATGEWAMECYKADIEMVMRTPGMAGYQMLDLQDYPGQGSALCGVLDAFMESKNLITEEQFRQFCSPVVPMAVMKDFCYWNTQPLDFKVLLCNYLEETLTANVSVSLEGEEFHYSYSCVETSVKNGEVQEVSHVVEKDLFASISKPTQLTLTLTAGKYSNQYHIWVYPQKTTDKKAENICVAHQLDAQVQQQLAAGQRVLLLPDLKAVEQQSVGGLLTPDYWNYAMFKSISESIGKPVSPGTLGLLYNVNHPLFGSFPGSGRSDWQWWSVVRYSRPLILDETEKDYRPLVQVVDNVERNHKLGLLMEWQVGPGRLMLCMTDLDSISQYPEGSAYAQSILEYMASEHFEPTRSITLDQLQILLEGKHSERDIQGVKNISDYAH